MKDRIPGAPGQFNATVDNSQLQKLQRGEPFTITLKRDDQPIVEGTPYSKAAVLPDALAMRLCPDLDDPSPADAFSALTDQGVISQGEKDGWTYRQWANGMAEIWGNCRIAYNDSRSLVGWTEHLPCALTEFPVVSMTMLEISNADHAYRQTVNVLSYSVHETEAENHEIMKLRLAAVANGGGLREGCFANVSVYIQGKWKDIINTGGNSYPVWEGGLY